MDAALYLKALLVLLSSLFTAKGQFAIVRGSRDIFRNLSSCSTATPNFCYNSNAEMSLNDNCICRCKANYTLYRNPDVKVSGGKFVSRGKPGCVWYANHRLGKSINITYLSILYSTKIYYSSYYFYIFMFS